VAFSDTVARYVEGSLDAEWGCKVSENDTSDAEARLRFHLTRAAGDLSVPEAAVLRLGVRLTATQIGFGYIRDEGEKLTQLAGLALWAVNEACKIACLYEGEQQRPSATVEKSRTCLREEIDERLAILEREQAANR
jgi:hypothetical protein